MPAGQGSRMPPSALSEGCDCVCESASLALIVTLHHAACLIALVLAVMGGQAGNAFFLL